MIFQVIKNIGFILSYSFYTKISVYNLHHSVVFWLQVKNLFGQLGVEFTVVELNQIGELVFLLDI